MTTKRRHAYPSDPVLDADHRYETAGINSLRRIDIAIGVLILLIGITLAGVRFPELQHALNTMTAPLSPF